MNRFFWSFVAVVCAGCFTSKPPDNQPFSEIDSVRALEGVYRNRGEGGSGSSNIFLSEVIFGEASKLDHAAITDIAVHASDDRTVVVTALKQDVPVRTSTFVAGKDFEIRNGKLYLSPEFTVFGFDPHSTEEQFPGVGYERVVLGLDTKGQGKMRAHGDLAALIFLIPFGGDFTSEARFVRREVPPAR